MPAHFVCRIRKGSPIFPSGFCGRKWETCTAAVGREIPTRGAELSLAQTAERPFLLALRSPGESCGTAFVRIRSPSPISRRNVGMGKGY